MCKKVLLVHTWPSLCCFGFHFHCDEFVFFHFFPMRLNRFHFFFFSYTPGFHSLTNSILRFPLNTCDVHKTQPETLCWFWLPLKPEGFLEYCEEHVGANTWIRRVVRVVIKSNTTADKLQEMGTFAGVLMCSRRLVRAPDVGGALVTLHCWLLLGNKIWRYCQTISLIVFWAARTARFPLCPHVVSAAADTGDKKWSEICWSFSLLIRCRICRGHGSASESS